MEVPTAIAADSSMSAHIWQRRREISIKAEAV
jgi:hypothetical protein